MVDLIVLTSDAPRARSRASPRPRLPTSRYLSG